MKIFLLKIHSYYDKNILTISMKQLIVFNIQNQMLIIRIFSLINFYIGSLMEGMFYDNA